MSKKLSQRYCEALMTRRDPLLDRALFGWGQRRRFTQDSPVLPDVWLAFREDPTRPVDLLLTPNRSTSAGRLASVLRSRLDAYRATETRRPPHRTAYTQSTVASTLTLDELVRVALPLTDWWRRYVRRGKDRFLKRLASPKGRREVAAWLEAEEGSSRQPGSSPASPEVLWLVRILGAIASERDREADPSTLTLVETAAKLLTGRVEPGEGEDQLLWSADCNRPAEPAVYKSTLAVKADAGRRLFEISCADLAWAVVDSGVDATHLAFRQRRSAGTSPVPEASSFYEDPFERGSRGWVNRTRVVATYDFTRVRELLDPSLLDVENDTGLPDAVRKVLDAAGEPAASRLRDQLQDLRRHLQNGRDIDWSLLTPWLEVPHNDTYGSTGVPGHDHGTHVAGILAADWNRDDPDHPRVEGMCPDLRLYDLRVLDRNGAGDEFSVLAALHFIRHLNSQHDYFVIHGANLSLSIRHDVRNFACGKTPVCEECERLVGAGVVVVAAAGNLGHQTFATPDGPMEGYADISLTDPGNAEGVITVGATHRDRPHSYGVSYFSSRGPTGDGRVKPDLVAPGEKISAPVPGQAIDRKDGTSMAAPHVSGAAAMLMSRHNELVGDPERIKRVLCETATDLGRDHYFQGHGMLDILRALQAL